MGAGFEGSGFRVSGFGVQSLRLGMCGDLGVVQFSQLGKGLECEVWVLGSRVECLRLTLQCLGFEV